MTNWRSCGTAAYKAGPSTVRDLQAQGRLRANYFITPHNVDRPA